RAICFGGSSQCSDSAQPRGTGRRYTGAESFRQPGVHNPLDYSIGRRGTHMFSNNLEVPRANGCLQTWLCLARVMRSCLLLLGMASSAISAPAPADCSRMYQVAQQVLGTARTIVTPIPSDGSICKVQDRDSGISNSPVGTLAITTYGNNGPSLAGYQRSTGRCETVMGLGQVADWCVLSNDYSHRQLSLVVYRNEKRLLDMTFSNWPDTPIVSLGEARSLAFQILAPYAPGSASRPPSPAPNSSKSDKLDQFKIAQSKKAEATACELVSKSDVESVAGPIDGTPTPNRSGTAETLCSFHFSDGRTITVRKSLLSKTDRNLATRVANGGFGCPELEI